MGELTYEMGELEMGELTFEMGDTDDRSLRSTLERGFLAGVRTVASLSLISVTLSFLLLGGGSEWVSSSDDTAFDERDALFARFEEVAAGTLLVALGTSRTSSSLSSSSSSASLAGVF